MMQISDADRKYPVETEVGELLERAYHKPQIGEELVFQAIPGAQAALTEKAS